MGEHRLHFMVKIVAAIIWLVTPGLTMPAEENGAQETIYGMPKVSALEQFYEQLMGLQNWDSVSYHHMKRSRDMQLWQNWDDYEEAMDQGYDIVEVPVNKDAADGLSEFWNSFEVDY